MEKIKLGFEVLGYVCVIATMVVALTPSPSDDTIVGKISKIVHKIMKMLPTIGINPDTRILEEKLKESEKKVEEKK